MSDFWIKGTNGALIFDEFVDTSALAVLLMVAHEYDFFPMHFENLILSY